MKISFQSGPGIKSKTTYGFSEKGMDFNLRIKDFCADIKFDSPEEAEEIAGAILTGLAKNNLPRRGNTNG